jgi:rhamnosyltransferase
MQITSQHDLQEARVMTPQYVCAVIVTYRPATTILEHLSNVLAQVQGLVVVDNGSNDDELGRLRAASSAFGFHLIENGENLGIAEGLNQGVRWAKSNGYPWVILFDQDSGITDRFIDQMFGALKAHSDWERVASIHPRYVDPKTGVEAYAPRAVDDSPIFPMTSGTLLPIWIFDKVGWFASEYFIDLVDWEYCFRIRASGFVVADASQAKLLHSPGDPTIITILGRAFGYSQHNAIRRYYISRNSIAFYRKYLFSFPGWVLKAAYRQLRETVVSLIADKDRAGQLRSFLLGTWEGLIGRMGKRENLDEQNIVQPNLGN